MSERSLAALPGGQEDPMNCPACSGELIPVEAGPVTVDTCYGGCGGIWFDHKELTHLDEPHEDLGPLLFDVPRGEGIQIDHSERRNCVRCDAVVMMRRYYSPTRQVELDECPECGGIWLDLGELCGIRSENAPGADRDRVTDEFLRANLQEIAIENTRELEWNRRMTSLFGFLRMRRRGY
jgi:uncharacterized protein